MPNRAYFGSKGKLTLGRLPLAWIFLTFDSHQHPWSDIHAAGSSPVALWQPMRLTRAAGSG